MECASIIRTDCAIRNCISSGCGRVRPRPGLSRKRFWSRKNRCAPDWPIDGTTGYDFLNACNGLLVYGEGLKELTEIYAKFIGETD